MTSHLNQRMNRFHNSRNKSEATCQTPRKGNCNMDVMISTDRRRHSRFVVPILLVSLFLLSACSSKQDSQSSAPPIGSAAAQPSTPMSSSPTPSGNGVSGQTIASAPAPSSIPVPNHEHLGGLGSATVITIHGKIVSVDRAKKLVTLAGPGGKNVSLHVRNPYNLAAAKPGDPFVVKFYEIVTVRKERPGESLAPVTLAEGIVTAEPGQTPGTALGRSVQVVATVVAKHKKTVDLQGPDGVIETVNVANPGNLKHVQVGDEIVITLTRVVAISIAKETGA
jgi:hypothetical protein